MKNLWGGGGGVVILNLIKIQDFGNIVGVEKDWEVSKLAHCFIFYQEEEKDLGSIIILSLFTNQTPIFHTLS